MTTWIIKPHFAKGMTEIKTNVGAYIEKAVAIAGKSDFDSDDLGLTALFGTPTATQSATTLVATWFGNLSATQKATLKGNLEKMQDVISRAQIKIVDAPQIEADREYYAQVRGTYNELRPVLSVELADQWKAANLDTRVNTFFHELSHRILKTIDLGPRSVPAYPKMMYGIVNAQSLASSNPDHALINAENYGYFIALANGLKNQAP